MALAFGAVDGAAADADGAAGAAGAVEALLAEALTEAGGSAGATGVLLLELQPSRPAQPRAVRAMANLRSGVTVSIVPWASSLRSMDLNSNVGESFGRWVLGDDEAVLTAVTRANWPVVSPRSGYGSIVSESRRPTAKFHSRAERMTGIEPACSAWEAISTHNRGVGRPGETDPSPVG